MATAVTGSEVVPILFVSKAAAPRSFFFFFFLAASLINVELRSEGCDDPGKTGCGRAVIKVNNKDYSLHRRGFNVAVFTDQGMRSPYNMGIFLLCSFVNGKYIEEKETVL